MPLLHHHQRQLIFIFASIVTASLIITRVASFTSDVSTHRAWAITSEIGGQIVLTHASPRPTSRRLSKHHHHHKHSKPIDYAAFSCDALSQLQAKYPRRFDKCEFAHACNEGDGILFPSLFCDDRADTPWYRQARRVLLLIFMSLSLLLLFRLLSSTTDEFFSPGLELFSLTLGLPPRFAGVTLLALGNGAPDVAATMNAMLEDERRGYEMALGELTGTCMFVTSVILGVIVSMSGDGGKVGGGGDGGGDEGGDEEGTEDRPRCSGGGNGVAKDGDIAGGRSAMAAVTGVPCQGPLLRDISVLILVCAVSMSYLRGGVVDYGFVYTLLGMYGAYVLMVLGADAYHLFYHKPSLLLEGGGGTDSDSDGDDDGDEEMIEQLSPGLNSDEGREAKVLLVGERTPLVASATNTSYAHSDSAPQQQRHSDPQQQCHHHHHTHPLYHHNSLPMHSHSLRQNFIEAMSNYSCKEQERQLSVLASEKCSNNKKCGLISSPTAAVSPEPASSAFNKANRRKPRAASGDGWAPVQDDGTEPLVIFHPHHAVHPHHGPGGLLFLRSKSTGSSPPPPAHDISGADWNRQHSWSHGDDKAAGDRGTTDSNKSDRGEGRLKESSSCDASSSRTAPFAAPVSPATRHGAATAAILQIMTSSSGNLSPNGVDGPARRSDHSDRPDGWREAWSSNTREFADHWRDFFADIYRNEENGVLDVVLLSVELPFTVVRKLTNPVPCDGYYCRPLVAISLALSPIWLWYYFFDQFDIDIFASDFGYILSTVMLIMGLGVMRYAPGGEGPMDFWMVVPLTLYGFAIAATWLDSIADKLVQFLVLFGILLRIPATVMGLMVLAPGNSLQDLVANVSLSKKGLSTMATTACLAGPIFNLCVGLGFGFWALMKSTGKGEIHVELPANIATGFYFAIANCALIVFAGRVVGKGMIGRGYGYVACGLYVAYVVTSLYV